MADADKRDGRRIGQSDRRTAVMHCGRRYDLCDRRLIFTRETDPVAMHLVEADNRILDLDSAVLDQGASGVGCDKALSAAGPRGVGITAVNQLLRAGAGDDY